ncbi:hypothetical protein Pyn_27639 [Prunus yedoensis var. nudiflora]|uniref:Ionotropic glutamate receptor C-terminal domain-containing protein n=1 Tax=Prunus yedoensis var. nudiflora TaxID=2094558 RepID=A0A314UE97_PRUYE|nr:hypothetical protein Pyn_27639 [Prunus yedoensis var. nudiflora]
MERTNIAHALGVAVECHGTESSVEFSDSQSKIKLLRKGVDKCGIVWKRRFLLSSLISAQRTFLTLSGGKRLTNATYMIRDPIVTAYISYFWARLPEITTLVAFASRCFTKYQVPIQNGFSTFVTVTYDPKTNTSTVNGGYCINIFEAVIKSLPYAVPYELHPYAKPNGEAAGSYNDLVNQLFLGNYDAAVGDITMRANRSLYVDFTLPYTESGVFMVVPIKDNKSKTAWVFLKPLTWELWVTSGCSFIFIGFVVWVLEHRINKDFRERVVNNLARFVVILWCFVVLILTQSYTASLTSLLTVQQLQPTVTDVNLLIKNRNNVAYQRGSFVYGILKQQGFQDENLKTFNTAEELNQLFHNSSRKYGISAAFDETPYMKLFLATYCSKYTMIPPTFKADGFGFVFPKGSPLAHDVLRAILNVSEGEKMKDIERIWFKKDASCADPNSLVSSSSLSLDSFWGLFLIAGVASAFALLIFVAMFLHAERQEILQQLIRLVPGASLWTRICVVLRIYDQWDLQSYTFQNNGLEAPSKAPAAVPAAAGAPRGAPVGAPILVNQPEILS